MFNKDLGVQLYKRFVTLDDYFVKQDSFGVLMQIIGDHQELSKLLSLSYEQIHWCANE